jgi:dTDP-glucose pyrophosphorylase
MQHAPDINTPHNTIILCGGEINFVNIPVHSNTNNSMIPVNGKPVISWILNDLVEKGIRSVIVVLKETNTRLRTFIERNYHHNLQVTYVTLSTSESIVHSLLEGLKAAQSQLPTRVILGDTLIRDEHPNFSDYIFVQEVNDSQRWCLADVSTNGIVIGYHDKQPHVTRPHYAVCGHYAFSNTRALIDSTAVSYASQKKQLSDVLISYQQNQLVTAVKVEQWFDFGNIDNLLKAKQQLLQSRFFNSLTIDPLLNTITKISDFDEKLRHELQWYKQLPPHLRVLTPRIISEEIINHRLHLVQEYYGYPTLSELFLYSDLDEEQWESIFMKLFALNGIFRKHTASSDTMDAEGLYLTKNFARVEAARTDHYWDKLLQKQEIYFNGKKLVNFPILENEVRKRLKAVVENSTCAILHGDLCFSNILYDTSNQIIRLIDPRGSFGKPGIYGDPRYDIAKLRHSVGGCYDYIVSDLFELHENNGHFEGTIFKNDNADELSNLFDTILEQHGYLLPEIRLIEAMLFISMVPLHKDKPQRQKMMYITGIEKLNELICV